MLGGHNDGSTSHDASASISVAEPLQLYEDPVIATAVATGSYAVAAAAISALLATTNNKLDNSSSNSGNSSGSSTSNSGSSGSSSSVGVTTSTSNAPSNNTSNGVIVTGGSSRLVSMGGGVFVRGLWEVSVTDDGEVAGLVERGDGRFD